MKRVDLVRRSTPALCIWLLYIVVICIRANPVPSVTKHDPAATLVVTNDGTHFHSTSPPVSSTQRPPTTRATSKRQGKQRKVASVDFGQLGFREDTNDYPEEEIRRLLSKTPEAVRDLFNVVNTELDPHMNLTERTAFYNDNEELGGGTREESVCRTVTRNIYPREATRHNSLVYIPNNQEFMQVIQAEICQHPDRECSYLRDALPYGMTSVCYQKYAYKKLLYLDAADKRMASDLFRYPSCCACFVRSLPFDLRSGGNTTLTTPTSRPLKFPDVTNEASANADSLNNAHESLPFAATTTRSLDSPTGRSLESQRAQSARSSKQMKPPSNRTVILSSSKVFEANK